MKLIDSKFASLIEGVYVAKFGVVYFFDEYIVTEINEGEIFNFQSSEELTELLVKHYGNNPSVHVISNRVNNYAVDPIYWIDFYKNEQSNVIKTMSFITYNELSKSNAKLEQEFIKVKSKCFTNLEDAMHWLNTIPKKWSA